MPWRMYRIGRDSTCHGYEHGPWNPADVVQNPALSCYSSEASGKKQTSPCLNFFICEVEIILLNIHGVVSDDYMSSM